MQTKKRKRNRNFDLVYVGTVSNFNIEFLYVSLNLFWFSVFMMNFSVYEISGVGAGIWNGYDELIK